MKKLNNKGYMLVEVIIASVISLVVVFFLMDITIKMVNKNNDYYIESVLHADSAVITKTIMDDINDSSMKLVEIVQSYSNGPATLKFTNGINNISKVLEVNNKTITYDDYKKTLSDELSLGNIEIKNDVTTNTLYIKIPAYTNYSDEDYGIKLIIRYLDDVIINIPVSEPEGE